MSTSAASPQSVPHPIVRRIVSPPLVRIIWKEYRSLRGLWVVLAAVAVLWHLIVRLSVSPTVAQMGMFVLPAMFAMGAAVLLFAWESEERTIQQLRILPVNPLLLFLAKVLLALAGTLLLMLLVGVLVIVFQLDGTAATFHAVDTTSFLLQGCLHWLQISIGILAWGIFYSLLIRRVLPALLLAPITLMVTAAVQYPYILFAVVGVADAWLAGRWLSDKPTPWPAFLSRRRARSLPKRFLLVRDDASPAKVAFARLLWLEWQNARPFLLLATGVGLIVIFLGLFVFREFALGVNLPFAFFTVLPALMGAWAFAGEQHLRRYRIPCDRGLSPQFVWLSKQALWLPLTFLTCSFLLYLDISLHVWIRSVWPAAPGGRPAWTEMVRVFNHFRLTFGPWERETVSRTIAGSCLWISLAYACGQFLSMNLPRSITAAIVALPMLLTFALWWLLIATLGIPLSWTVAPIPLVLMALTLFSARDWLLERTGRRRWFKVAGVVTVPFLVVLSGVILFRVTEIPKIDVASLIKSNRDFVTEQAPVIDPHIGQAPSKWSLRLNSVSLFHAFDARNLSQHLSQLETINAAPTSPYRQDPLAAFLAMCKQAARVLATFDRSVEEREFIPPDPGHFPLMHWPDYDGPFAPFHYIKGIPKNREKPGHSAGFRGLVLRVSLVDDAARPLVNLFDFLLEARRQQIFKQLQAEFKMLNGKLADDEEFRRILGRLTAKGPNSYPEIAAEEEAIVNLLERRLDEAANLTTAGRLDDALMKYLVLFQMSHKIAALSGTHAWMIGRHIEEQTFDAMQPWLVHPRQSSRTLRITMFRVQGELSRWPSLKHLIAHEHQRQLAQIDQDWSLPEEKLRANYEPGFPGNLEFFLWCRRLFPWEKMRSRRLCDATTLAMWNDAMQLKAWIRGGHVDLGEWLHDLQTSDSQFIILRSGITGSISPDEWRLLGTNLERKPWAWNDTTMAPPGSSYSCYDSYEAYLTQLEQFGNQEARRRGRLLVMGLVAWRLEHGALPEQLEELTPEYFALVPTDPWTGRSFGYRPKGFPLPAELGTSKVEANRPVLWSAGPDGSEPIRSLEGERTENPKPIITLGERVHLFDTRLHRLLKKSSAKLAHVIP